MRSLPCRLILFLATFAFFCATAAESRTVRTSTDTSLVPTFDALCQALRDNYPMLEYAGWRDEWTNDFRARIAAAPSRQDAFQLMDEFVCLLNDYHTRFVWPDKPQLTPPPFHTEPLLVTGDASLDHSIWGQLRPPAELPKLNGIAIVAVNAATNCGVRAGDEILRVNGLPVLEALRPAWRHAVGCSVAGKLRSAAGKIFAVPNGESLRLQLKRRQVPGSEEIIDLEVKGNSPGSQRIVATTEFDGLPLIRLGSFANRSGEDLVAEFDDWLSRNREASAIIIDVRNNGGGEDGLASRIIGRFIAHPVISSISFHRQVPGITFERTVDWTEPRGWRYRGRVAVLTDEGCMSATEHFVSGMSEAGALLCGTPTSGACGWIRRVDLPGKATLFVSQTFPLHTGGIPSPMLGMAPQLWAVRSLSDILAGRDTALNSAAQWLKSNTPLPPRTQPIPAFSQQY